MWSGVLGLWLGILGQWRDTQPMMVGVFVMKELAASLRVTPGGCLICQTRRAMELGVGIGAGLQNHDGEAGATSCNHCAS